MRMLYAILGKDKFQEAIRRYLLQLQYKSTSPDLLYQALQYSWEGKDLSELMAEWTNVPGVPMVTVTRSEGNVTISQVHISISNKNSNLTYNTLIIQ